MTGNPTVHINAFFRFINETKKGEKKGENKNA